MPHAYVLLPARVCSWSRVQRCSMSVRRAAPATTRRRLTSCTRSCVCANESSATSQKCESGVAVVVRTSVGHGGSPLLSACCASDDFIKTKAESIDGLEVAFERGAPPELVLMDDRERETVIRCAAATRCPFGWCRCRAWRRSRHRVPGVVLAASAGGSPTPLSSSLRRSCGRSRRPHHVLEQWCTCA